MPARCEGNRFGVACGLIRLCGTVPRCANLICQPRHSWHLMHSVASQYVRRLLPESKAVFEFLKGLRCGVCTRRQHMFSTCYIMKRIPLHITALTRRIVHMSSPNALLPYSNLVYVTIGLLDVGIAWKTRSQWSQYVRRSLLAAGHCTIMHACVSLPIRATCDASQGVDASLSGDDFPSRFCRYLDQ